MLFKVQKEVEALAEKLGIPADRFRDEARWSGISKYRKLSEDFIKEFCGKVNWFEISRRQKLSEDFIREFADRVHWFSISAAQKLSKPFIEEFSDKLDVEVQIRKHHQKIDK